MYQVGAALPPACRTCAGLRCSGTVRVRGTVDLRFRLGVVVGGCPCCPCASSSQSCWQRSAESVRITLNPNLDNPENPESVNEPDPASSVVCPFLSCFSRNTAVSRPRVGAPGQVTCHPSKHSPLQPEFHKKHCKARQGRWHLKKGGGKDLREQSGLEASYSDTYRAISESASKSVSSYKVMSRAKLPKATTNTSRRLGLTSALFSR